MKKVKRDKFKKADVLIRELMYECQKEQLGIVLVVSDEDTKTLKTVFGGSKETLTESNEIIQQEIEERTKKMEEA